MISTDIKTDAKQEIKVAVSGSCILLFFTGVPF